MIADLFGRRRLGIVAKCAYRAIVDGANGSREVADHRQTPPDEITNEANECERSWA
jgi:hypothetical protein